MISKPKIIARKVEKSETPEVVSEVIVSSERPKARLVSREHAGESLLRSVIKQQSTTNSPLTPAERDVNKKPLISFQKVETKFRPLENRPVMQIPPEERRGSRPPRPTGASSANPPISASPARLRDSSKPMFQRDITFSTPTRDGTAKK
ncbi:MAG: Translation initiation factor [Patescibacteria group bacterium]|nr:Translation initiation factor [Patescibacteria group bacterium]